MPKLRPTLSAGREAPPRELNRSRRCIRGGDVRKLLRHIPKGQPGPLKFALVASVITMGVSCLSAQTANDLPSTIDCAAFTKHPNGTWYVGEPTTVAIGTASVTLSHIEIGPGGMRVGGADLYTVLEHKCGGTRS